MAYELRENSGSLFKNKKDGARQPHTTGTALVGGVKYYISCWTRKDKNGDDWHSLSFTLFEERKPAENETPQPKQELKDDDIPFN